MEKKPWTITEIKEWIESQTGPNHWYQTIQVKDGIVTPGTVNSVRRLHSLALPDDLSGKSVLDVGCNSGMLCLECKKRNADRVVGIDLQRHRLEQARTLAEMMELDVEFNEVSLFHAPELGQFDLVFCIAVLTGVTDLIRGLEILTEVTRGTLYLELATTKTYPRRLRKLGNSINTLLETNLNAILTHLVPHFRLSSRPYGEAKLRRIDNKLMTNWSLVPDRRFLNSVMGDQFEIDDLGQSERYELFKLTRKSSTNPDAT